VEDLYGDAVARQGHSRVVRGDLRRRLRAASAAGGLRHHKGGSTGAKLDAPDEIGGLRRARWRGRGAGGFVFPGVPGPLAPLRLAGWLALGRLASGKRRGVKCLSFRSNPPKQSGMFTMSR